MSLLDHKSQECLQMSARVKNSVQFGPHRSTSNSQHSRAQLPASGTKRTRESEASEKKKSIRLYIDIRSRTTDQ